MLRSHSSPQPHSRPSRFTELDISAPPPHRPRTPPPAYHPTTTASLPPTSYADHRKDQQISPREADLLRRGFEYADLESPAYPPPAHDDAPHAPERFAWPYESMARTRARSVNADEAQLEWRRGRGEMWAGFRERVVRGNWKTWVGVVVIVAVLGFVTMYFTVSRT